MKQIAIIDHMGGIDFHIIAGHLADCNHAVYTQDGRLFLVRVERVYQTGQDALYIEDRSTAVITLASGTSSSQLTQIIARLQGMTAWDWLTQEALTFHGQQYDFHII
ncbi:hypothetical protein [Paenibacillus sp. FSL H8-0259]|uniref:hypothetical protein n=1 Tax=Paenibacillus sp. FSL H8-0259 TaxID=1920423 RepID=UPI00096FCCE0|nr:hypothetical protein [Paenibacillus sp. FSL H8-0259]OMF21869.1 hypothetical protein BK132_31555 [Paenibacillus sp. FSL H8-0259]